MAPDENRGKFPAKYVSYVLSKDYRGKGYMTEALNRCGFQYEMTLEKMQTNYDGQVFDAVCFSLLAKDSFTCK